MGIKLVKFKGFVEHITRFTEGTHYLSQNLSGPFPLHSPRSIKQTTNKKIKEFITRFDSTSEINQGS